MDGILSGGRSLIPHRDIYEPLRLSFDCIYVSIIPFILLSSYTGLLLLFEPSTRVGCVCPYDSYESLFCGWIKGQKEAKNNKK